MARSTATPSQLSQLVHQVACQLNRAAEHQLATSGLSLAQWRILDAVSRRVAINQQDLAGDHGLTAGAVSRQVEELVKHRWLNQRVDSSNRRQKILTLTTSGRHALHAVQATAEQAWKKAFVKLSAPQRRQLSVILNLVTRTFSA